MPTPRIHWDLGTAYDFFVSLEVLHNPGEFGVRASWAAGVRARLPVAQRETLEQSQYLVLLPAHWILVLPEPRDVVTVLRSLEEMQPAERLTALVPSREWPPEAVARILEDVAARGSWDKTDLEALKTAYRSKIKHKEKKQPSSETLGQILDWWVRPEEFGGSYLEALQGYQESFFAEEERRIRPALQAALSRAQELAERLSLSDLLEELSQGLRFDEWLEPDELVLAPSYWTTPFVYTEKVSAQRTVLLYGARPPDASLIPGEVVPDNLMRALKALSDPTRLRILHYLTQEPLTLSQLWRRLRLRAPTVVHHLRVLRLAGLVQVIAHKKKDQKRYATRSEAVAAAFTSLRGFLGEGGGQSAEDEEDLQE
jgi:DNA-binding transcriptional ArsR family regulator